MRAIPFSPPDISEAEINEVVDTLRSGWITTGPKTKKLETELSLYCGVEKTVCMNSATAGMEMTLRLLGIGKGDEVITTPYTYAATANVILHTGARVVFADVKKDSFLIDPEEVARKISSRTKAVICVDFGGEPCDYVALHEALNLQRKRYHPRRGTLQESFERPVLIADSAHAFGASYRGQKLGKWADFTVFSFHAVKNLTTAEGGAVVFDHPGKKIDSAQIYRELNLMILHGQNKDALAKAQTNGWKYTIEIAGYKHNMTDIQAALGLAQLRRYDSEIIPPRKDLHRFYMDSLGKCGKIILPNWETQDKVPSFHLFPVRIVGAGEEDRDRIIRKMAEKQISCNVHFIPVVMHPAYTRLGYSIFHYPNCYAQYANEISLPLYSTLKPEDALRVSSELISIISE